VSPRIYASTNNGFPHADLMYARDAVRRGAMTPQEYSDLVQRKVEDILRLQEECGIDVVTGGAYGWDDLFSPFFEAAGVTGMQRDGLIRFFDNNTYYRRPVINGKLVFNHSSVKPMVQGVLRKAKDPGKLKAFLPGPYTFASLSENTFYGSMDALLGDLSELLHAELEETLSTGVGFVEVCDPSLGWVDQKLCDSLAKHYKNFVGDHAHRLWFTMPFHEPNAAAIKMLRSLGDSVVSLDLSSTTLHGGASVNDTPGWSSGVRRIVDSLSQLLGGARLDLGVVDARNTLLEDLEEARRLVSHVLRLSPEAVYVSNNASLDFLPEAVAFDKVRLIGRLKLAVNSLG
jgi:5-methyltetrahydropteroyltriglutamate--homocysteine methyltransferase